jgi:hypothetical protein
MESTIINKHLSPSLTLMNELIYSLTFKVAGGPDFLNEKEVSIKKSGKQLGISFTLSFDERKYVNDVLDTPTGEYKIINETGKQFSVHPRATLLLNVNQINQEPDFEVSGSVSQISTSPLTSFENKFHRVLIPTPDIHFSFFDYQHFNFTSDADARNRELIKVSIKDYKLHLFAFKVNENRFWAVDSLQQLPLKVFQELSNSVFNAYGFLEGDLHLNEAYYFSSDSQDFSVNLDFYFSSIRSSLLTGYGIFVRNPYSVFVPFFKNQGKPLDHEYVKGWYEKLPQFAEAQFSKLAELFYEYDSLTRAALIILEANTQPLELKAASYCVAFEAVCHTIKNHFGIESQNVIDNTVFNSDVKPQFLILIDKLKTDGKINDKQADILSKKLNNWNQPTNADSLTAPFKKYGYTISKEEFKCIDNRNKFLHGSLPVNERNEDESFKELYYISMMIHKLIYILFLKMIGYDGYIVNYPKLHEHITGRVINEDLLIKP